MSNYNDKEEFSQDDADKIITGGAAKEATQLLVLERLRDGQYKFSDYDSSTATVYLGYVDKDGNWIIKKIVDSSGIGAFTYCSGSSNYSGNWTNRAALTYQRYNDQF